MPAGRPPRNANVIATRYPALFLAVAVITAGTAACTDSRPGATQARTVTVTGTGEAEAPPDQASINAGVQSVAATVIAASRDNEEKVRKIMEALTKQGIEESDIGTTDYSIWAQQNFESGQATITGYQVSNVVVVTIKDIAKVGDVLAAVTNAGANTVHGINFSVSDTEALETDARERAMADARRRAESLVALADVRLGDVITLSTSAGPSYGPMMMESAAMRMSDSAPRPTITPGQQSVSVQVQVTYGIH
jgi:uncharacterized protein YggE